MLLAPSLRLALAGGQLPSLFLLPVPVRTGFNAESVAGRLHPNPGTELSNLPVKSDGHFLSSLLRDNSCKSANAFPWASISSSAVPRRSLNRAFSARNRFSSAATGLPAGPRFLSFKPSRAPLSRCRRHCVISDEYRLSRRRMQPTCPRSVAASISARILSLYSAENRRGTRTSESSLITASLLTTPTSILPSRVQTTHRKPATS